MNIATLTGTSTGWFLAAALSSAPFAASAQSYYDPNAQGQQPYQGQQQYGNQPQPQYGNQPQYGAPQYGAPQSGAQQTGDPNDRQAYDQGYQDGQLSVSQAPPPLPQYDQPECPGDGYIWTPGYWAYGPTGYYWINGAWVVAPYQGALWTPGYWGFDNGFYGWNAGYWGPTVGFYGGINYGFGYFGTGFYGGYWNSGRFFYNRGYTNIGFRTHSFYEQHFPGVGSVHPGGQSFATSNGGRGFGGYRGAYGNGNYATHSLGPVVANGAQSLGVRPTDNRGTYLTQQGRFGQSQPMPNYRQQFGGSQGSGVVAQPRQTYSAPAARSAPAQSAPSGGGFHGSTGGGGSHGGSSGGGSHH